MNEKVMEKVAQWIIKAENDFKTGVDEITFENPATDTICFDMAMRREIFKSLSNLSSKIF